jgi:hypothetical protein
VSLHIVLSLLIIFKSFVSTDIKLFAAQGLTQFKCLVDDVDENEHLVESAMRLKSREEDLGRCLADQCFHVMTYDLRVSSAAVARVSLTTETYFNRSYGGR